MFWIVYIVITVDTIFCLPGFACRIQKIQKKNHFISIGSWEHPKRCGATCLSAGALKVPFLAKMTKMPLVSPRFDQRSIEVKTLTKHRFS